EGVENDGGLAGLVVADDELELAATDGNERVNGLEACGHRLVHGLARENAGRFHVHTPALRGLDRAFAVDGVTQRIDHAAKQLLAHGHVDDGAGPLDRVALSDAGVRAENNDTDVVGLEVERHAPNAIRELDHLTGLHGVEAVDARDAVADRKHLPDFRDLGLFAEVFDLLLEDCGDLSGPDVHQPTSFMRILSELSFVRSDESIIRLPIFTTSPPRSLGSTFRCTLTSLPTDPFRAFFSSCICSSFSGKAEMTSASTSPRALAHIAWNALIMSGKANRRRLRAASLRKLPASPPIPTRSSTAEIAANCSSLEKTGLRTRRLKSSLSFRSCWKVVRSCSTCSSCRSSWASSKSADA